MNNLTGQSLGRYHILEQLGEGGMAIVYKAYDTRLETEVAVKVIRTESLPQNAVERSLKRFEREAKALARLTHPNIVKVTDYGEFEGKPYLVMPFLPGGTLKQKLNGKPMSWQEAVRILLPIAHALTYAHELGMVHRDVKPSNILITHSGDPMLTDFGIAKMLDLEETMDLTGTNAAVGTPEYMAPEQVTSKTIDRRADIYALGVVLYEMVTGRKPFQADTPMAVLFKHVSEPLPRPSTIAPNLPQAVENVLLKALAKKPEDRYQTMGEVASELENLRANQREGKLVQASARKRGPQENRLKRDSHISPFVYSSVGIFVSIVILGVILSDLPSSPLHVSFPAPAASFTPMPLSISSSIARTTTFSASPAIPAATEAPTATKIHFVTETPTKLDEEITDAHSVLMRLVSAGDFTMGSNNDKPNDRPAHTVYLDNYYIDKYEVTNRLYKACVDTEICQPPKRSSSHTRKSYYGNSDFDNYPVIYVDWSMASAYCGWRGAQLPTEAEWEKAANGTQDYRSYQWSDVSGKKNDWGGFNDTTEAGESKYGLSSYGVYDLTGNVWEWVNDWYGETYYQISPSSDPLGPDFGVTHVLRGSTESYGNGVFVQSSYRGSGAPDSSYGHVGFRCARSK